jgi:hypothetical protein
VLISVTVQGAFHEDPFVDFEAAQSLLVKRVTFRKAPCLARCRGVKMGHATAVCFVSRTYLRLTLAPGVPKLRDSSAQGMRANHPGQPANQSRISRRGPISFWASGYRKNPKNGGLGLVERGRRLAGFCRLV